MRIDILDKSAELEERHGKTRIFAQIAPAQNKEGR